MAKDGDNKSDLSERVASRFLYRSNLSDRVAKRHLGNDSGGMSKTAGEIRFVKDQGELKRDIPKEFRFRSKNLKPLSKVLWSLSCSMGHMISAHSKFTKLKAVHLSPDGKLGGKGYIQSIKDMRAILTESVENLSNVIDTIHDEIEADHWQEGKMDLSPQDQKEVDEAVSDSEDIMSDPEEYAEQEYQEEVSQDVSDKEPDEVVYH